MDKLKIFMSYSSVNLEKVNGLKSALADKPIDVFVAEDSVHPGEDLPEKITKAVNDCDIFILYWCKMAEQSKWVQAELALALKRNKHIIPIVFDEDVEIPLLLNNIKYIDATDDTQGAFLKVQSAILEKLEEVQSLPSAVLSEIDGNVKDKSVSPGQVLLLLGIGILLAWLFTKD